MDFKLFLILNKNASYTESDLLTSGQNFKSSFRKE